MAFLLTYIDLIGWHLLQIFIFVPRPQGFDPKFLSKWWYFQENWNITQSYQLFSSDVRTDLRHLTITLSRSVKIYPINQKKKNHVNQDSRISYPPRERDLQAGALLLLSGYLIQNMGFSRCTGGSRKNGSTDHFGTKFVTFQAKSALVFKCLLSCKTFGPLLCLHEITLALVFVVEAVPTDEKDKGNTGNSNSGNNSHTQYYTSFLSSY